MLRHDRQPLTDSLIGPVQPRFQRGRHCALGSEPKYWSPDTTSPNSPLFDSSSVNCGKPTVTRMPGERNPTEISMTSLHELGTSSVPANTHTVFRKKSNSYKTPAKRLERCRINQQRYRERKQAIRSTIIQLEREIDSLERDIRLRRESRSPCRVVADTLKLLLGDLKSQTDHVAERQLVEALGNSFALDVAMGDVSGVDALINQLQRYEQYFDDPRIRLEQIEEPALGVVTAAARLGVTVSVYTLYSVFPKLLNASRNEHDTKPLLGKRLLGKRLHCDCSIRFIFDEKSGRVARLEASVNWIGALHGALGNLKDVSNVLDGALINC